MKEGERPEVLFLHHLLARPHPHRPRHRDHEDPAVARPSGPGGRGDRLDQVVDDLVLHDQLDPDLGEEVDVHRPPPVLELDPLLLAPARHFADGHPHKALLFKGLLDLVQPLGPDYGLNFHHRQSPPVAIMRKPSLRAGICQAQRTLHLR